MNHSDYAHRLEDHYAKAWGRPTRTVGLSRGPLHQLSPEFSVLVFRQKDLVRYATRCMSWPSDTDRIELHMLCNSQHQDDRGFAELLTVTAHFHRTGEKLGLAHTVSFGRPYLPDSACTHGLLSLPYLDGPSVEWLAEEEVHFLWFLPITAEEAAHKRQFGLDALETLFEESNFDYLDPRRRSVVP